MRRLNTRRIASVGITTLTAVVATVFMSGCIVVRRPPEPEEIRSQALAGVTLDHPWKAGQPAQGEVLDNWLASFGDSTLDGLVREALAANPDLRIAAARMQQAGEYLVQ